MNYKMSAPIADPLVILKEKTKNKAKLKNSKSWKLFL